MASPVTRERYVRDAPGGYERVTVERFEGERPADAISRARVRLLKRPRVPRKT